MHQKWGNKEVIKILRQCKVAPATEKLEQIFKELPSEFTIDSGIQRKLTYWTKKFKITNPTLLDTTKNKKKAISHQNPQKTLKLESINQLNSDQKLNFKCPYLIDKLDYRYPVLNLPDSYLPCILLSVQHLKSGQIYKWMNAINNQGGGVIIIAKQIIGNYIKTGFTNNKIQTQQSIKQSCITYLKSILYPDKNKDNRQEIYYHHQDANIESKHYNKRKQENKRNIDISIDVVQFQCQYEDAEIEIAQHVYKIGLRVCFQKWKNELYMFDQNLSRKQKNCYAVYRLKSNVNINEYIWKQGWQKVPVYQQMHKNYKNRKIIRANISEQKNYCMGSIIFKGNFIIFSPLLAELRQRYNIDYLRDQLSKFPKKQNDGSTFIALKYEIKQQLQLYQKLRQQINKLQNTSLHTLKIQEQNNKYRQHNGIYMMNYIVIAATGGKKGTRKGILEDVDAPSLKQKVKNILGDQITFYKIEKIIDIQLKQIREYELQQLVEFLKQLKISMWILRRTQRNLRLEFEQKRGAAFVCTLLTIAQKEFQFYYPATNAKYAKESNWH